MDRAEEWLMLAFPGSDTGRFSLRAFAPAKNGKSWYRRLGSRDSAIRCKRELVADGVPFKCVKIDSSIVQIYLDAKAARLAHDRDKLEIESLRQDARLRDRDVYRRAQAALALARGEQAQAR